MKTKSSFNIFCQWIVIVAIIVSSMVVTRKIISGVKHEYSLLPAGSGKACLYDIMR